MGQLQKSYRLPVVVTRNQVYFPKIQSDDLDAGRRFTVDAINMANTTDEKLIIVVTQRNYNDHTPKFETLFKYGVLARMTKVRELQHHVTIRFEPLATVKLVSLETEDTYYVGEALVVNSLPINESVNVNDLKSGLYRYLQNNIDYVRRLNLTLTEELVKQMTLDELTYYVANRTLNLTEERMAMLRELDPVQRLELLMKLIEKAINNDTVTAVSQIIRNKAQSERVKKSDDEKDTDIPRVEEEEEDDEDFDSGEEILEQLKTRYYPPHVVSRVKKEVRKMNRVDQNERARIIEYLDWVLKLPYDQETIDNLDLDNIQKVLDKDHYGLKDPKQRIVEFVAMKRLAKNPQATVLCFYGPPGTGKTSLAMSIATAMGRKLVKSSLGGIDDESKLRGFLRTYVGAQPGNIISSMRKAGTINPIFVLDEVDKLGSSSHRGDPNSALLEILDPQQNKAFTDHYIDEAYDLSKVIFIATANYIRNIPRPLLDRMELIELKGYTMEEKIEIAKRHLIPTGIVDHGLEGYDITFTNEALQAIIDGYTFEAGVRSLNRQIAAILRKISVEILKDNNAVLEVTAPEVKRHLGNAYTYFNEKEEKPIVGVVTGLSVVGGQIGEIMKIEVTTFKGKGSVNVTGNLEKMLRETGDIAASHVRSYARTYGVDPDAFLNLDINVHFPEANSKDGNSAGLAIALGIISVLTNRPVNSEIAMTGEITLMGRVLAIGGVYEKMIGAIRAGIKTVIIPKENERDLDEIPEEVKAKIKIVTVSHIDEALNLVLLPPNGTQTLA